VIVNRAQFAEIIGCALGTVDKYIRLGMPAERDGREWRLDSVRCTSWIYDRERTKATKPLTSREQAEARIIEARASLRELEVERVLRSVVHVDDVAAVFSERQAMVRTTLGALPELVADAIAAEADPARCRAIIRQGVHDVLDAVHRGFGGRS
jgi:phage terminase Nu1 subunit (DNA packaging protein)